MAKRKNPAAVALGKLGGKKKVPKGFALMDPESRQEIARKAIATRWKKAKRNKTTVNDNEGSGGSEALA